MLFGLTFFALRAGKTLGDIGTRPTRDPDPAVQARKEKQIKLMLGAGVALLALVIALAALGVITLDAQAIG